MTATDITGTVLLTGPTGGLGRALLEPLARRRPEHLVLLGRSAAAMRDAARRASDAGARAVSVVEADLADLDAVARAGRRVSDLAERTGAPSPRCC
ncbi:KR domain-containing protein [Quadrisphaera sp. DSM 44207]|uniref:KR domain-containing protein n=1 Tax=Quadrisphaera sp. DSM 44207 TaxID=1881057 RepID=UPI00088CEA7B|nr:KR domain-containing protein [Quadrisphaera sp. DSM 44207]SDQ67233.1 KR domain-containing protein [Quadrisphaera sp. DSM 44207]